MEEDDGGGQRAVAGGGSAASGLAAGHRGITLTSKEAFTCTKSNNWRLLHIGDIDRTSKCGRLGVNGKLHRISTMKGNNIFRVALLSYIVLTIGGKELKSTNSGENTGLIFTNQQVNKTIQMEPSSSPIRLDIKSPLVAAVSHAKLSTIDCPIGTVPILRNNKVDTTMVQRINTLASNDLQQLVAGIKYWDEIYGSRASINVYEPKVKENSKDLSASWIQIGSVPEVGDGVGIGAGSCVYPSFSGDSFARFHISWDNEELKKNCIDHNCPGFVQVSHSVGLGGRIHPISVYNGPQYVINVLIFKDPKTKNWWLAYGSNNTPIGYWPSSQFLSMKDKCNFAFWGGYVQGLTTSSDPPQIGSGHFASEGFGKAAFIRNIQAIEDENNKLVTPNTRSTHPRADNPKLYTYDDYGLNDDARRHSRPSP
uniref:Neprosin PEP catalytic domain-containing protein n=1 Tax=Oryza punctata TaxID=4537 RepID=A0A0E0K656_ORYPU